MHRTFSDQLINVITYIVYAFFTFVCLYPFYYLIINSISANNLSERGKVIFWPLEIHFTNYKNLATIPGLTDAAVMSVLRTVVGTVMTVMIAAFLGYMFTRQTLWRRKLWYRFVAITMYFNAGIIPWYLAMKTIGLTNNFWGYILPTVIQPFYIILCKTYCESVPQALQDAAEIDGAGTLRIFFRIMLPVIKPILATIAIFAAVNQWNAFQDTLLLMRDKRLYTLQYVLYQYITQASSIKISASTTTTDIASALATSATATSIRMTVTVVVVIPVMMIYPFFQRFFTKGIMIGAVKG
ncbi:MAG: carbohydrate ABC transporter permease [Clostridia bacterium]|nr:carbohydrate ABC transporter permease [Clostridia bacterium]